MANFLTLAKKSHFPFYPKRESFKYNIADATVDKNEWKFSEQ